jgi:cobalt-zinc-cadmium resistance protein CzcA
MSTKVLTVLLVFFLPGICVSQPTLSLDEVITIGLTNNPGLKAKAIEVEQSNLEIKTAFDLEKTNVYYNYDENNISPNDRALRVFGVAQNFEFPTTTSKQQQLLKQQSQLTDESFRIQEKELELEIRKAYYTLAYYEQLLLNRSTQDSLYEALANASKRQFELGETNYIASLTAENQKQQIKLEVLDTQKNVRNAYLNLQKLILHEQPFAIDPALFYLTDRISLDSSGYLGKRYYELRKEASVQAFAYQRSKAAPEIQLELFTGSNAFTNDYFNGIQLGLDIPILSSGQKVGTQIKKLDQKKTEIMAEAYQVNILSDIRQLEEDVRFLKEKLNYFDSTGLKLNETLIETAKSSYISGEISSNALILFLAESFRIKEEYLATLHNYHLQSSELKHLSNQ